MIKDFVLQTASAPGAAATINLIAPPAGRLSFVQAFGTGGTCYYFMDDDTQAEWGIGLVTAGTPDTLARQTVRGNTAGSTARLNFSAGVRVYNELPSSALPYYDYTGNLNVPYPLHISGDPTSGYALQLKGRSSDNLSIMDFGTADGAGIMYRLQASYSGLDIFCGSSVFAGRITALGWWMLGSTNGAPSVSNTDGWTWRPTQGMSAYCAGTTLDMSTGGSTLAIWRQAATQVGSITVSGSSTSYNTSSDYRLKTLRAPLSGALDRLDRLPVYRGVFNVDPGTELDLLLAHEVAAVVPEAVHGAKDALDADGAPVWQQLDASKLVPLLIAAVTELAARLRVLEGRSA